DPDDDPEEDPPRRSRRGGRTGSPRGDPVAGFPDPARIAQAPDEQPPGRAGRAPDDAVGEMEENQEDTDLGRSRAGRRGQGGGPTRAGEEEDEENEEEEFKSDLLIKALGLEDSPVGVFGWLQGSYTGNQFHPRNGQNFGVTPNMFANKWLFQQLYFAVEKRIGPGESDESQLGFRVDSLGGSDFSQFPMVGLFDPVLRSKYFGYDPVQFYGEVHLPWLTEGGVDVKGGRFYSL